MVVMQTTRLHFWLSVKVFGFPYLEYMNIQVQRLVFDYKFMVVRWTTAAVFLVVRWLFWLSWAHGQPEF